MALGVGLHWPTCIVFRRGLLASNLAIAVGTEDIGLTDSWCKQSENHIVIPMLGVNDSLNVSVAAGIILFEALRQRK